MEGTLKDYEEECGGRDGPLTADHRSRGLGRPGPGSDGGELEQPLV